MKTDFLASGDHFVVFSRTAVNWCHWKAVFSSTGTYFSANPSLRLVKKSFFLLETVFFIPSFFLVMENISEIWEKSNFKDEPYSC